MECLSLYEKWKKVATHPEYDGIYNESVEEFNQIMEEIGPQYVLDLYKMFFGEKENEA